MTPFWRMAYRLALALGEANPREMLGRMPATIWDGWVAFNNVEPIGEPHADYRSGIIAMLMGNAWLKKKGQRPYTVQDFIPEFGRQQSKMEEMYQKVMAANRALGGTFIDRRKEAA